MDLYANKNTIESLPGLLHVFRVILDQLYFCNQCTAWEPRLVYSSTEIEWNKLKSRTGCTFWNASKWNVTEISPWSSKRVFFPPHSHLGLGTTSIQINWCSIAKCSMFWAACYTSYNLCSNLLQCKCRLILFLRITSEHHDNNKFAKLLENFDASLKFERWVQLCDQVNHGWRACALNGIPIELKLNKTDWYN